MLTIFALQWSTLEKRREFNVMAALVSMIGDVGGWRAPRTPENVRNFFKKIVKEIAINA